MEDEPSELSRTCTCSWFAHMYMLSIYIYVEVLLIFHCLMRTPLSLQEASSWIKAIEDHIKKIISESVSHKRVNSVTDFEKKEIVNLEGNGFCADCNAPSKDTP